MAMKLKQQCQLREHSNLLSSTVASLRNFHAIKAQEFFAENHFTRGMTVLCENGFKRLAGVPGSPGFFRLTESMGGGKTHNLLAFGLMAQDASARKQVLSASKLEALDAPFGNARIVTFEGYQSPQNGVWGHLASQLGSYAESAMRPFYENGLQAPGQDDWARALRAPDGKSVPTVVLLDELPVYLQAAGAKMVGAADLASITAIALANLIMAVEQELPQVVLVMTDLNSSSWQKGSNQLENAIQAASSLEKQSSRTGLPILPVQMNSEEIYQILRKRIFSSVGSPEDIAGVQKAFLDHSAYLASIGVSAPIVAKAKSYANQLSESYPFHPSLRDLFGRFKENEGFQQTRGILRMMQAMAARCYADAQADPWLVSAEIADLNNADVLSAYNTANAHLITSIAADVADNGNAVAEQGALTAATPHCVHAANVLLFASLAKGAGQAILGLTRDELEAILSQPGREPTPIRSSMDYLIAESTYLHHDAHERMFYRENKNINSEVKFAIHQCPASLVEQHIEQELKKAFNAGASSKWNSPYQELLVFPDAAGIQAKCAWNRSVLAIVRPDEWEREAQYTTIENLRPKAEALYDTYLTGCRNKLLMLSLDPTAYATYKTRIREVLAYGQVIRHQEELGVSHNDPAMTQARRMLEQLKGNIQQAFKSLPSHLIFPHGKVKIVNVVTQGFVANGHGGSPCGHSLVWETLMAGSKVPTAASSGPVEWLKSSATLNTEIKRFNAKVFGSRSSLGLQELEKAAADCMDWTWCSPRVFQDFVAKAVDLGEWKIDELQQSYVKKPQAGWPQPQPGLRLNDITPANRKRDGQRVFSVELFHAGSCEYAMASSPELWRALPQEKLAELVLDEPWIKLRPIRAADPEKGLPEKVGSDVVGFNENIVVDAVVSLQGGLLNAALKVLPVASQSMCELLYTVDGSAPANSGVPYPGQLPGPLSFPANSPCLLVLPVVVGPDGQKRKLNNGVHQSIQLPTSGKAAKARVGIHVPLDKPTRYLGNLGHGYGESKAEFMESAAINKGILLLNEKKGSIVGAGVEYLVKGADGSIDYGSMQLPQNIEISAETLEKIGSLISREIKGELHRVTFEELRFACGQDMMDFIKKQELPELDHSNWQELEGGKVTEAGSADSGEPKQGETDV